MRILVLISFMLLLGCNPAVYGEDTSIVIANPNQRYEVERFSVLPPKGDGWKMNYRGTGDSAITFNSKSCTYNDTIRKAFITFSHFHISIDSFATYLNANDFDNLIKKEKQRAEENQAEALSYKNQDSYASHLVTKAGMRCVTREEFSPAASSGVKYSTIRYFCEQPNQPKEFPPIEIIYSESALAEMQFVGPDAVLAPIWNSLQFKPINLETSVAYQKWKIANAKAIAHDKELQQGREERKRRQNAAKP